MNDLEIKKEFMQEWGKKNSKKVKELIRKKLPCPWCPEPDEVNPFYDDPNRYR